ncbi:MAG: N-glycosylase/DNA lyase [Thermoplasmata archaeon]
MKDVKELILKINEIKPKINGVVRERLEKFRSFEKLDDKFWFSELVFCILTANTSAEMGIKIQNSISPEEFASLSYEELRDRLKSLKYRFYNTRARYIYENQVYAGRIKDTVKSLEKDEKRNWLIENIKGFGFKESSHFLRNVGFFDYAIIDKHIFNLMREYNLTDDIKINSKNYIILEGILRDLSKIFSMSLGELDLYLWYLKTGKVLK